MSIQWVIADVAATHRGAMVVPLDPSHSAVGDACVVSTEGSIIGDSVQVSCRETVADHKVPDLARFCDALPQPVSGKAKRLELARVVGREPSTTT
jgi:acyl-coenzyme A synthetase/AMP-(fatty) acid ligase